MNRLLLSFKELVVASEAEMHKEDFVKLPLDLPSAIHKASENSGCICCGNRQLPVLCIRQVSLPRSGGDALEVGEEKR